jgi:hypothetical protein
MLAISPILPHTAVGAIFGDRTPTKVGGTGLKFDELGDSSAWKSASERGK